MTRNLNFRIKKAYRSFAFLLPALILAGCNNGDTGFPIDPMPNVAPEAQNISVSGDLFGTYHSGLTAILHGEYYDQDGDEAGEHRFRWLRDGAAISGAESYKYTLQNEDEFSTISGCITPIAETGVEEGLEVCSTIEVGANIDLTTAPSATVSIDHSILAFEGTSVPSKYTFTSNAGREEGNSLFFWITLDHNIPSIHSCDSGQGIDCTVLIPSDMAGKPFESCVLPVDETHLPGALVCDEGIGAGIELTGSLDYRGQLKANVQGYPNDLTYEWRMDLTNMDGINGNQAMVDVGDDQPIFTVGSVEQYQTLGLPDYNNNGVVDDHDWQSAKVNGEIPSDIYGAYHYIGKEVQFCAITAATPSEVCIDASEVQNTDGSLCTDSTKCVAGGVYFDATQGIQARGVGPTKIIEMTAANGKTVYFHRPITEEEYKLRSTLGLGNLTSQSATSYESYGIQWTRYQNGAPSTSPGSSPALDYCLNMSTNNKEWSLPVSSDIHNEDSHAIGGNQAPTDTELNLKGLADNLTQSNVTDELSHTYGWPMWGSYHSATAHGTSKTYPVSLSRGAAQGYSSNSASNFVTCISQ